MAIVRKILTPIQLEELEVMTAGLPRIRKYEGGAAAYDRAYVILSRLWPHIKATLIEGQS